MLFVIVMSTVDKLTIDTTSSTSTVCTTIIM